MKKIILILLFSSFFALNAKSQINAGVGTIFKTEKPSLFGVQARVMVGLEEYLRLGTSISYYLGSSADWSLDVDAQFTILTLGENFHVSPMAGINFTDYGSDSDIGLNIGAFTDFRVNEGKLRLYFEPKYLVSDASSFVISVGAMF